MNIKFISSILLTCLLICCGKKTQVKGIVYSRHGIPMPNVSVSYERYGESSYPETSYWDIAKTDANGVYKFSFRGTKRFSYHVKCFASDSGYQNKSISLGTTNNVDLNLQ